jgi:hypothetical protein
MCSACGSAAAHETSLAESVTRLPILIICCLIKIAADALHASFGVDLWLADNKAREIDQSGSCVLDLGLSTDVAETAADSMRNGVRRVFPCIAFRSACLRLSLSFRDGRDNSEANVDRILPESSRSPMTQMVKGCPTPAGAR